MSEFAYCNLADVEGTTGFKYDAESQPSRTEAREVIIGVAAEIDGVLEAVGYTVPVSSASTRTLAMLKRYNVLGAAYRLWHADIRGTDTFPAAVSWETDFKDFLDRLTDGKVKLPAVDSDNTNSTVKLRAIKVVT